MTTSPGARRGRGLTVLEGPWGGLSTFTDRAAGKFLYRRMACPSRTSWSENLDPCGPPDGLVKCARLKRT